MAANKKRQGEVALAKLEALAAGEVKNGRFKSKYDWADLKPGDSFYFEGRPRDVTISYGYYKAKGTFKITKEGNGFRFHRIKR